MRRGEERGQGEAAGPGITGIGLAGLHIPLSRGRRTGVHADSTERQLCPGPKAFELTCTEGKPWASILGGGG